MPQSDNTPNAANKEPCTGRGGREGSRAWPLGRLDHTNGGCESPVRCVVSRFAHGSWAVNRTFPKVLWSVDA